MFSSNFFSALPSFDQSMFSGWSNPVEESVPDEPVTEKHVAEDPVSAKKSYANTLTTKYKDIETKLNYLIDSGMIDYDYNVLCHDPNASLAKYVNTLNRTMIAYEFGIDNQNFVDTSYDLKYHKQSASTPRKKVFPCKKGCLPITVKPLIVDQHPLEDDTSVTTFVDEDHYNGDNFNEIPYPTSRSPHRRTNVLSSDSHLAESSLESTHNEAPVYHRVLDDWN
jgi:hypothetical protein